MSFLDDVDMPADLTKLPADGTFTLTRAIRVDAQDLRRFFEAGGEILQAGHRLFISDPTRIIAKNVERLAGVPPDRATHAWKVASAVAGNPTRIIAQNVERSARGGTPSDTGVRHVPKGTPLRAGDLVYRVIEVDPPPDVCEPHTWKVASAVVERASARQVKLKTRLLGLSNLVFEPSAFGRLFYETPLQAIQAFLIEKRLESESLDRRRKEADRAVAWAMRQEGVKP